MRLVLFLALAAVTAGALPAADRMQVLRGHLRQAPGKEPVIEAADHKSYKVSGDEFTKAQMADSKLNGREMELDGRFTGADQFEASRIYTVKNGKRYDVTYWCDVCSIRTHMPGRCMCCQGPTELQEIPVP